MQLVNEKVVTGWDDPRMPTISGMRRRGVTAEAVRAFAYNIGMTKYISLTDMAVFEHAIREDLNKRALRRLAVLRPIKVVITNYPRRQNRGTRGGEQSGRSERAARAKFLSPASSTSSATISWRTPPPKYFRLRPGGEVRLKYAYIIKCDEVIKDASGNIAELRCTADLDSKTGGPTAGRKVKGTIHWVSAAHAIDAEVRLYDRLFTGA